MKSILLFLTCFLFLSINTFSQDLKALTENYEVVLNESFSDKSLTKFRFRTPSNWMITKNGESGKDLKCSLGLNNLVNSYFPQEIALLNDGIYEDFVLTFSYMQKNKNFSIRDICVLFGYQDSTHYYFAQAAAEQSKYCHNIFKVDNDRPVQIGTSLNNGVIWNYQKWHHITVVRKISEPKVELYIDDELVLESSNANGIGGNIGFGTFGSGFKIDNLKIWVPKKP